MRQPFIKRSFTAKSLIMAFYRMMRHFSWTVWGYVFRGIERPLAEKILLMVSAVNDCRYCCWFHGKLALDSGVDEEQVANVLNQLLPGDLEPEESAALRFALHYAESASNPDEQEITRLHDFYAPWQVKAIQGLCATIHFGNLCGNTVDAFISRIRGHSIDGGSVLIETLVFIFCAPLLLPVLPAVRRTRFK